MGASLDYVTAAPVPEATRQAIESALHGLEHDWWAETMTVGPDRHGVGFLLGRAKLFLIGYDTAGGESREVDPNDDSLMAWRDASFVVAQLERWSRDFDVAWELRCEGELVGKITSGAADPATGAFLAQLLAMDHSPPAAREARLREIAARHADRW